MHDLPRQKLREIVAQYGCEVTENPQRCKALLLDHCGEHRREVHVLVLAMEERVAADLRAPQPGVPLELLLTRLTKRLVDDCGLAEDVACWAVETWAMALGVRIPARVVTPTPPAHAHPIQPPSTIQSQQSEICLTLAPGVTMELVHVPAGEFLMGSDKQKDPDANDDEMPQHKVYLDAYYIGRTPVTNAQYQRFVQAAGHRAPGDWKSGQVPAGLNDHPVVLVSWDDAVACCRWLTRELRRAGVLRPNQQVRLPTEAEWEKAARGADERIYPWGNQWDSGKCNSDKGRKYGMTPVGADPAGASPYGCLDMAGNVWEWCADWYDAGYYQRDPARNPTGPGSGEFRVLRGGSFANYSELDRCAWRFKLNPDFVWGIVGFRVVVVSPVSPDSAL